MSVLYLILLFFDGLIYQETDEQTDKLLSRCSIQLAYCLDLIVLGVTSKKKQYICWHCPNWSGPPSLLPYFWQIYFWHIVDHVDLPPSPRIFDKNHKILGFKTLMFFWTLPLTFSIIPITFWGSGVQTERHRFPVDVIAD